MLILIHDLKKNIYTQNNEKKIYLYIIKKNGRTKSEIKTLYLIVIHVISPTIEIKASTQSAPNLIFSYFEETRN